MPPNARSRFLTIPFFLSAAPWVLRRQFGLVRAPVASNDGLPDLAWRGRPDPRWLLWIGTPSGLSASTIRFEEVP